jgi:hypothetical protein
MPTIGPGITIGPGVTITAGQSNGDTPTAVSNATVVATSPYASGSSYRFTGATTSYVYYSGYSGLSFGTGDFTVEWYQYETDANTFPRIYWQSDTAGASYPVQGMSLEGTNPYAWFTPTTLVALGAGSLGTFRNVWTHFALVRLSGRLYFYKNGTQIGTAGGVANTTNLTGGTQRFYIGGKAAGGLASEQFGGDITSFRACNIAVYTGSFTRPTSALQTTQSANPYGGSNTSAITAGQCIFLMDPT